MFPEQTGELLFATGAPGGGFTITLAVEFVLKHPAAEVVFTVYVPASSVPTPVSTGFCEVEENPFGPFHTYVAPVGLAVRLKLPPTQAGELLEAAGADGVWLIVTAMVAVALIAHPGTVADTEYVPEASVVTLPMVGSCMDEEKLFGPVQL